MGDGTALDFVDEAVGDDGVVGGTQGGTYSGEGNGVIGGT